MLVWQITGGFFPDFPITVRLSAASVPAVVPQSAPQHPALAAVELALLPPSTRLSKSSRIWKYQNIFINFTKYFYATPALPGRLRGRS